MNFMLNHVCGLYAPAAAQSPATRGTGYPEGYLEAFTTLYSEAVLAIDARKSGGPVDFAVVYPAIEDGVMGVALVEACLESLHRNGEWVSLGET